MTQRICLVGGNGFIGSHIIDQLKTSNRLFVYDRSDERYRERQSGVEYMSGDLGNHERLRAFLQQNHIDSVVHLASHTTPQTSIDNPFLDIQDNLISTLWMLKVCAETNIQKLLFLSSGGTVYGIPRSIPLAEDHPTDPISSYGIVKLAIEKYIALYGHMYDLDWRILRPANPYGARQDPEGEQGIISIYLWRVLHKKPVIVYGDGGITRDYFYVTDLARAVEQLITYHGKHRIFNVGGGRQLSIHELIQHIERLVGRSIKVQRTNKRSFDVPRVLLDIELAEKELHWQPRILLEEGLAKTYEWLRTLA